MKSLRLKGSCRKQEMDILGSGVIFTWCFEINLHSPIDQEIPSYPYWISRLFAPDLLWLFLPLWFQKSSLIPWTSGSCSVQWPLLSSAPLPRVILSEGIQPMKTKKLTKFFKQSLLLIVSLPWLSISRTVHNFDTGCPSLSPALPPFSVLLCLKCVTLVLSPRPLWLLCFLPLFTKTAF